MASGYSQSSPYFSTPIVGNYLDIIKFRNIPNVPTDVLFSITSLYEYRPDLLAFDLYNNVNYWWVFAVRNKDILKDPIYDFYAGQVIYLPNPQTLSQVLGS